VIGLATQVLVALVLANLYEWILHKYVLHALGKKKSNPFHYHWTHHRAVRKSGGYDAEYEKLLPLSEEARWLLAVFTLNLPLLWIFPYAVVTFSGYAIAYYFLHRKAHMDIEWGKRWLPWHYDHHLGKNQDLNWCVLFPLWDHILGTRKKY